MRGTTIASLLSVCLLAATPLASAAAEAGAAPATDKAGTPAAAQAPATTPAPATASEPAPTPTPTPMAAAPPEHPGQPLKLSVSVKEALQLGIQNNLNVEAVRYDPQIADLGFDAAWGAYEPNFHGQGNYARTEQPSANSLESGGFGASTPRNSNVTRTTSGEVGIGGLLPKLGWQYDLTFKGDRNYSTNTIFYAFDPQFTSGLNLQATMPIGKGFLWGEPWVQVKATGIGRGIAFQQFRQQLMDTVLDIETKYWALAASRQDLAVAEKSLETAKALLQNVTAQYDVGVVSKVDVVEAEAGLAQREFELITAENFQRNAQDQLLDAVLGTKLRPSSEVEVELKDSPEKYQTYQLDEEVSAKKAFDLRPELEIARDRIDQQELQVKFAKNQRLPQVDVVGSYGYAGLGGVQRPPGSSPFGTPAVPSTTTFWGTTDHYFNKDQGADSWAAGLVVSMPIGNSTARSKEQIEELRLHKAKVQETQIEQGIIVEVRLRVRNLRSALEGIAAAERRVAATTEQLRAEQIRLEHGESTPFNVLDRENDLVAAQRQRVDALQAYRTSVARLDRAQGSILQDRNIVVERALPLR